MQFNEKLQELRKQKGITQAELADVLYVSRTAISKWESGRGYPNIESLLALSSYFSVTVDELLSGKELLNLAQEETKQTKKYLTDLIFGLLDISTFLFLVLPLFGQKDTNPIHAVSLFNYIAVSKYLTILYFSIIIVNIIFGIALFAMQNSISPHWVSSKYKISIILTMTELFLFIISIHPYASVLSLFLLIIKAVILTKKHL